MQALGFVWGAFGLVIGSFLNVCIYRLPRNESIVFPGSHCPHCGNAVRPFDNIPVVSFLILRGRCRSCRGPISWQYPLVELLTGIAFYACAATWGLSPAMFVNSLYLAAVLVLVFVDYQHQILPNKVTLPGIVAGIALSPFQSDAYFSDGITLSLGYAISAGLPTWLVSGIGSALGALVGAGVLFFVATAYKALRKRQGLGQGDIKMMAMVGAFTGWPSALLTVFFGSFMGSVVGLALVAFGGRTMQSRLAFGTFLGAGSVIALFFGPALLRWYIPA
jgi:leader peptidase (prepilin peptidase)/N-methyltransferase